MLKQKTKGAKQEELTATSSFKDTAAATVSTVKSLGKISKPKAYKKKKSKGGRGVFNLWSFYLSKPLLSPIQTSANIRSKSYTIVQVLRGFFESP